MKAKIDSKNAKREHSKDQEDDTCPAKERGKKRQYCKRMAEHKSDQGVSFEFHHALPAAAVRDDRIHPQRPRPPVRARDRHSNLRLTIGPPCWPWTLDVAIAKR